MTEESLFAAALEVPSAAERRAFLDAACGGDPGLRDRVERLLAADGRAAGILEQGLGSTTLLAVGRPAGVGLAADQAFAGRFRLRRKLGEGGMGEVWAADQTDPVRRPVALKVIRPGLDSGRLLARFEAERQALAMMDHPNIARVLDAGADDNGRPYFVMELVEGVPITRYCDDRRLTPRERLGLFVPVCQAVQHAHQKGVIHRDLKPSNVLVAEYDGRPVPKVIDFGIAKATGPRLTEDTLSTEVGALIGTLEYMSPEQADPNNRDIDTRADVYALGVVLYELLTGELPFARRRLQAEPFAEMLRILREVDPPRPSTRLAETRTARGGTTAGRADPRPAPRVPRLYELDWIVMKCLEKDRTRRYESASALAADVGRYLADEPVLAGPPSAAYRVRKLVRRHWRALAATSAFVLLLVAAVVGLTVALVAVNRERRQKEAALEAAGRRQQQARAALDAMTSEVIGEWLSMQPALAPRQKEFLEAALRSYEEFAADTGHAEGARAGVAQAYLRAGSIRERLGQHAEAEAAWDRARELYAGLAPDFPDAPAYRQAEAEVHLRRGALYRKTRRNPEAEQAYGRALAIQEELAAAHPGEPDYQKDLAVTLNHLGILLEHTKRRPEAERAYRRSLAILTQLVAGHRDVPGYRYALGGVLQDLGMFLDANPGRPRPGALDGPGPLREAAELLGRAVATFQQLAAEDRTRREYRDGLARAHNHLGNILRDAGRYPAAEDALRETLAVRKELAAAYPMEPGYRRGLAITLTNLGILLKNDTANPDRVREGEDMFRDALAILRRLAADFPEVPDHQNEAAGAMVNQARRLLAHKDLKGARRLLEEALPHHQAALAAAPDHLRYRQFYRNNRWRLAEVHLERKDHAGAAEAAGEFLAAAVEPPREAYIAAGLFAGCARLAAEDDRLPEGRREELAAAHGDRAVAALRQAIEAGAEEVAEMGTDPALKPLQRRADFRELLAEVDRKRKP